jgi:hypothetical protein
MVWLVERINESGKWKPIIIGGIRAEARRIANYYNGFARGKKDKKYRVKPYVER